MTRPILLALWCLALNSAWAKPPGWSTDYWEQIRKSAKEAKPVVLHFRAEWCGPCKVMEKETLKNDAIRDVMKHDFVGIYIDIDKEPEIAARYGVTQLPSDLVVDSCETPLLASQGKLAPDQYLAFLEAGSKRYCEVVRVRDMVGMEPLVPRPQRLILNGFCPVTLVEKRIWQVGDSQWEVIHRNQKIHFASAEAKIAFEANPADYELPHDGVDPITAKKSGKVVFGKNAFGAIYDKKYYFFDSEENRDAFKANPEAHVLPQIIPAPEELVTPSSKTP